MGFMPVMAEIADKMPTRWGMLFMHLAAGVLLFALALPQLAQIGVNLYYHWKFPEMNLKLLRGNWITLLTMCAKIILGTALFFGGRSLSNLWFRMRNFRQPPHADGSSARES